MTVEIITRKKCRQVNTLEGIQVHLGILSESIYRLYDPNRKSIKEIINFMEVIYVKQKYQITGKYPGIKNSSL